MTLSAALLVVTSTAVPSARATGGSAATTPATSAADAPALSAAAPTRADDAAAGLMSFFQPSTGLFSNRTDFDFAAWWTSGVAVRSLAEYSMATGSTAYLDAIATTYDKNVAGGSWGTGQFRNEYIDDTGWWAMAWISAYDLTGQQRYLDTARAAADHMARYWTDDVCGGGVLWSTGTEENPGTYRSSISNTLYLEVSAALHRRIPGDTTYLRRAVDEWRWFAGTGLIGQDGLVMDGRSPSADGTSCGTSTARYTYNQGQLVAGLVELYRATGTSTALSAGERADLLVTARRVADATTTSSTLNRTTTVLGLETKVLLDGCEPGGDGACGGDGPAFKGPAVRGIAALNRLLPTHPYSAYLYRQQAAAETYARTQGTLYGLRWFASTHDPSGTVGPKPQSAALALFDATLGLPDRTVTVSTDPAPSASGWYLAPVTVTLGAPSDEPQAPVEHSLDDETWDVGSSLEVGDGLHTVRARVLDTASASPPQTVTELAVDTVAPEVSVSVIESAADGRHRTVTLDAQDATSGVLRTEYRLAGEEWSTYTEPVVLNDAVTTLEYRSVDVAGNETGAVTVAVPRWSGGTVPVAPLRPATTLTLGSSAVRGSYGAAVRVAVTARTAAGAVTGGTVRITEAGRTLARASLVVGRATLTLPRTLALGSHRLTVVHDGSALSLPTTTSLRVVVSRSRTRTTAKVLPARRTVAKKTVKKPTASTAGTTTASKSARRTRLRVTVRSVTGVRLTGTVVVTFRKGGRTVATVRRTVRAASGEAVLTLARAALPRAGRYRVTVTYRGSTTLAASTVRTTARVGAR